MMSFITVARDRRFAGEEWKNAIKFFLDEIFKESSFVMSNPFLQFIPENVSLILNKKTWVYQLDLVLGDNVLCRPQPAHPADVEIIFSGNQRSDVELVLREFVDKNFIKMVILILPPKKMILWKNRDKTLGMQVDDATAEDLELMEEDDSSSSEVK